jgi:hypothetical protein
MSSKGALIAQQQTTGTSFEEIQLTDFRLPDKA